MPVSSAYCFDKAGYLTSCSHWQGQGMEIVSNPAHFFILSRSFSFSPTHPYVYDSVVVVLIVDNEAVSVFFLLFFIFSAKSSTAHRAFGSYTKKKGLSLDTRRPIPWRVPMIITISFISCYYKTSNTDWFGHNGFDERNAFRAK